MTKPLSPNDVVDKKLERLPPEVIASFNELIAERWDGSRAVVLQKDAIARIETRLTVPRRQIFENGWLDIEDIYRKEGWNVVYDKPAYNETYDAKFEFSKVRTRG